MTSTKGKEIHGKATQDMAAAFAKAKMDPRTPFTSENLSAPNFADRFRFLTKKLATQGLISSRYSVHDLRHAFAVKEYQANRDIYALKEKLGHASIQVTEMYIRSIRIS